MVGTRLQRKREAIKALAAKKFTDETLRSALREHRADIESDRIQIGDWDVSDVTDMQMLFSGWDLFNQSLNWNTSGVRNMAFTFDGCTKLNKPLLLDTSNVELMAFMFADCASFNQPLATFDTRKVTDMGSMFYKAARFNQSLAGFDTSNVRNMGSMFDGCVSFNQPLGHFRTSKVTTMSYMLTGCTKFDQDLEWDTGRVTTMAGMFAASSSFNRPLRWDTRRVTDMSEMFLGCSSLSSTLRFDMRSVRDKRRMLVGSGAAVEDVSIEARRAELRDLNLRAGDTKALGNECTICYSNGERYLIHPRDPASADPHMACGECIENLVLTSLETGIAAKCPRGCGRQLDLSELSEVQKAAFGRYARKAARHKLRADVHRARARWYALKAAEAAKGD